MKQPRDAKGRFRSKKQQLPALLEQATGIVGLKGFNQAFMCRGKRYKEGRHYHVDGQIQKCINGMHFCTDPLSVFNYYSPDNSRYAIVVGSGKLDNNANGGSIKRIAEDTKHAVSDLYVVKELPFYQLVNILVHSASKSTVLDRHGDIEGTEYPWDIKYRVVSVQHTEAILTTDVQEILHIGGVLVNDNTRGYAGPLYDVNMNTLLSVVTRERSIAYGGVALSLSPYSIAKGRFVSMAFDGSSVADAKFIAVATGNRSIAMTQKDRACCICQGIDGKVIMYGSFSVGILRYESSAEVYGSHCTLVLGECLSSEAKDLFLLKDGTNLLWQDTDGALLVIVAGADIKSSRIKNGVPVYTARQISDAFLRKKRKRSKK